MQRFLFSKYEYNLCTLAEKAGSFRVQGLDITGKDEGGIALTHRMSVSRFNSFIWFCKKGWLKVLGNWFPTFLSGAKIS